MKNRDRKREKSGELFRHKKHHEQEKDTKHSEQKKKMKQIK